MQRRTKIGKLVQLDKAEVKHQERVVRTRKQVVEVLTFADTICYN